MRQRTAAPGIMTGACRSHSGERASPSAREDAVETADIMPTLAAMLGLPLGAPAIDGRCLDNVLGNVCPAR